MLDMWLGWRLAGLGVSGAQAMYQTVITLTLSFIVFTFGSLLVAIQVASGQLTPRIIATTLLRDNVVRYSVGLFVFTLVFAVMALDRLETTVHEMVAFVTACLGIACMATFLFLIDYAARLLRPVSIVARVGDEGLAAIKSVYPQLAGDAADLPELPAALPTAPAGSSIMRGGRRSCSRWTWRPSCARRSDSTASSSSYRKSAISLPTTNRSSLVYSSTESIDESILRATVAMGSERTIEQDPLFAFRILVDIALKALSPAINDPTTAVLAIDQIHRLLRVVGRRQLRGESILDETGRRRVIYRTPNWEDFVNVACTEIRSCGASNVQIARRLRAMLENLVASLPAHRHARTDRGASAAGSDDRAALSAAGRSGPGAHSGFARDGRLVGGPRCAPAVRELVGAIDGGVSAPPTRTGGLDTLPAPRTAGPSRAVTSQRSR